MERWWSGAGGDGAVLGVTPVRRTRVLSPSPGKAPLSGLLELRRCLDPSGNAPVPCSLPRAGLAAGFVPGCVSVGVTSRLLCAGALLAPRPRSCCRALPNPVPGQDQPARSFSRCKEERTLRALLAVQSDAL